MRGRLLKEQDGFTLPEMLVTMVIMIVVFFALHNIFSMSIRVFSFGNDKVEAVENARLGLEKMEREIRGVYPVNGPTGVPRYRFFTADGTRTNVGVGQAPTASLPLSNQITFGNERGTSGNGAIQCGTLASCEYITYKLTRTASPSTACSAGVAGPCTLRRVNTSNATDLGEPVVEFVRPPVSGDANRYGLRFRYFAAGGTEINPASPGSFTQEDISRVEISLQIAKDGRTQNLTTEVTLRNPGKVS